MDGLPGIVADGRPGSDGDGSVRTDAYHATLRTIVLDISTSLMRAEPDEFETKLQWGLETVGDHVGADRGYVFRQRGQTFALETEWTADGVDPRRLRRIDLDDHDRLRDRLESFENVTVSVSDDDADAAATREFLRPDGAGSAVLLPMVDGWSLVGFVGFDVPDADRSWGDREVTTLRTAADIVTHSIARVRRERTLAEQNERLEAFASVVSHDLRNPLNVVTGSLELAATEVDSDHVDRATRAASRMEVLIDRMLTLARAGEDIGETRPVRLGLVAERAWDAIDAPEAALRVGDGLGRVDADPDRLQEAFENLFRNSVEHGGDDVTVRVGPTDDGFRVADDGPGIPPDQRESVFDRGYTADDGTGLGLSIVRRIVDAHGWSVRAGAADGGGARFDVTGVPPVTE
jgi:signal transduction histidine kinase